VACTEKDPGGQVKVSAREYIGEGNVAADESDGYLSTSGSVSEDAWGVFKYTSIPSSSEEAVGRAAAGAPAGVPEGLVGTRCRIKKVGIIELAEKVAGTQETDEDEEEEEDEDSREKSSGDVSSVMIHTSFFGGKCLNECEPKGPIQERERERE
jgi:hypothetical protein